MITPDTKYRDPDSDSTRYRLDDHGFKSYYLEGTYQDDAMISHDHLMEGKFTGVLPSNYRKGHALGYNNTYPSRSDRNAGITKPAGKGSENRPKNAYVIWLIKK